MTKSKYVIMRDSFLINPAVHVGESDSYPVAIYDEFVVAQSAMQKFTQDEIDNCSNGNYKQMDEFDVASTKHWCSINSKRRGYYIAFRLFAVPYNSTKFEEESPN